MKISLAILSIAFSASLFGKSIFDQFPEPDHNYGEKDKGWSQYLAKSIYHTNTIALTFDDGPHPVLTPRLLDILKKHNVHATFFVLAEKINEKTIPIIERIVKEGHMLASHDWDHANSNQKSESTFKTNLKKSVRKIKQLQEQFGSTEKYIYYRFPYGAYGTNKTYHHMNAMKDVSRELFGENCINFVFWDIDTSDWVSGMSSEDINQTFSANFEGGTAYSFATANGTYVKKPYQIKNPLEGGVVLMHDIHERSINSVERMIEYANQNKIEIVPLSEIKEYSYESDKDCRLKE